MTRRSRGLQQPDLRVLRLAGVAALLTALLAAGCAVTPEDPAEPGRVETSARPAASSAAPAQKDSPRPTAPSSSAQGLEPARVALPAIDLAEPLIELGLDAEGGMQVPDDPDDVGWFTGGGRPGGRGPLVIAGHIDSDDGPAIFIRLQEMEVGDDVEVTDVAGTVFRYRVSEVADYPKSTFPTARVFGAVASDELRLITCGGVFDREAATYVENRVVYAVRTDG